MRKEKKNNRPILLAVAAVLALILIVGIAAAVILEQKDEKKTNPAKETDAPSQVATEPNHSLPDQPKPTEPIQTEAMGIDTDYCELKYPASWADYLYIMQDNTSVAFFSRIDGHEKQPLFTIWFGGTEGTSATTITDYWGKPVEVRVSIQEFVPDDTWSQEDIRTVYAMQEDLNYLLQNLK